MEQTGDIKVSVVIPCYNQGKWLWEAIDSVLAQDMSDFEIIVINDGSTDPATNQIIGSIEHPKITTIVTPNQGLSAARNEAISRARGTYILPLDSDDRIHPTYLSKASRLLDENPQLGIVYCQADFFGEKQGVWDLEPYRFPDILISPQIFATSMYRRTDWEAVGGYRADMIHGWEDYDFWLSLIGKGVGVHRIDEVLFSYRKTTGSMAGLDKNQMLYSFKKLFEHHRDLYEANIGILFEAVIATKPLRDRLDHPSRETFEVFIPDIEGYAGRDIREQNYPTNVWSRISIYLDEIPESGIHLLRIDPAQKPGLIDIASIRLLNSETSEVLRELSTSRDFQNELTLGDGTFPLPHDRLLRLFCSHEDSHFFLPKIDRPILEQPLQLEVWIRRHPDFSEMKAFCTEKIESIRESSRQEELHNTLSAYEQQATELRREIENLQEHGKQLESRANQFKESLINHQKELQRLSQEKTTVEQNCEHLAQELEKARNELEEAQNQAQALEKELTVSRSKEGFIPRKWFGN